MNSSPSRSALVSPTSGQGSAQSAAALQGASLAFKNQPPPTSRQTQPQPGRGPLGGPLGSRHSVPAHARNTRNGSNGELLAAPVTSSPHIAERWNVPASTQTPSQLGSSHAPTNLLDAGIGAGLPLQFTAPAHPLSQEPLNRQPSPHLRPPGARPGPDPRSASFIAATLAASRSASPSVSPHHTGQNTGIAGTPLVHLPPGSRARAHSTASSAASLSNLQVDAERSRGREPRENTDTGHSLADRRPTAPTESLISRFEYGEHGERGSHGVNTDPIKSPSPGRGRRKLSPSKPRQSALDGKGPLESNSSPTQTPQQRPKTGPKPKLAPKPRPQSWTAHSSEGGERDGTGEHVGESGGGRRQHQLERKLDDGETKLSQRLQTAPNPDGKGPAHPGSPGSTSTDDTFFSSSSGRAHPPPSPPPARRTTKGVAGLSQPSLSPQPDPRPNPGPDPKSRLTTTELPRSHLPPMPSPPRLSDAAGPALGRPPRPPRSMTNGPNGLDRLNSHRNPALALDSLTNAIVAGSIASARGSRSGQQLLPKSAAADDHGNDTGGGSRSRSPPKRAAGMLQTLRSPQSKSDDEEARRYREKHRKRGSLGKKHTHHEGSRRRWREQVSSAERRRYEALWASNRGLFLEQHRNQVSARAAKEANAAATTAALPYSPPRDDGRGHGYGDSNGDHDAVVNIVVRDLWSRSRLPFEELAEVWELVDRTRRGTLSKEEFVVGTWLIDQRLRGRKIPARVSQSVWDSVKGLRVPGPGSTK